VHHPKLDLGTNIVSENLETYRKRKHSPDSGSTPTSRTGESPRKAAAKRRRQSEEGQGTSNVKLRWALWLDLSGDL
jgi:hypothetical protein